VEVSDHPTSPASAAARRRVIIGLAVFLLLGAGGTWIFHGDLSGSFQQGRDWLLAGVGWLQELGPLLFYAGFAIACVAGVPASVFIVTGAAAFGPGVGLAGAVLAVAACITLTHLFARYCISRPARSLLERFGYQVPQARRENWRKLTLILRITPGIPLVAQNYLIPLSGVPLRVNLPISLPIQGLYLGGFVFLGDAFTSGRLGFALGGIALLVVAVILLQTLRKRYAKRPATDATR
jgi:uncharacterized membrane protein YdjX (TVP38/TMEM64 family)